ncbi:MAG: sialate O-acetylesterase [Prolixibacteraceae bacterium]
MKKRFLITTVLAILIIAAKAEIKLPSIFTSNMVMQQESQPAIWGWTDSKSNVKVTTSWNNKTYEIKADQDGKWKQKVETIQYGGPYEMTISDGSSIVLLKNILLGEVWLCGGQSNMEMPMKGFTGQPVKGSNMDILKAKNPNIRLITVPRNSTLQTVDDFEGKWEEASPSTVAEFSAAGYYFGRLVNELIDVPIGLISVNYGGSCVQAWMSRKTAVPFGETGLPQSDADIKVKNRTPTTLFNGMLNPVIGYGIRGALWYQGETNYEEADKYVELFPKMVTEWRELWQVGEFPFYYCQIAPFDYAVFHPADWKEKYNSAYLREAQLKCTDIIPNTGMAVLMDCAHPTSIHPSEKDKAGERLALLALAKTYGLSGFASESPTFKAMEIVGSTATISFNNVPNGITGFDEEITTFEIAAANKVFYPATVWLRNKSVVVSSPKVKEPVAVRYAFKDAVKGQLFSTEGLPVSSFRTDDW